jgi:2-dehydro-3-deoxy-D-gluconate 5-dehydrogenase
MEFPTFRLDDKIAIVTGSRTGIGRASAIALAQAGADVVITTLPGKEALAEEVAAAVREAGRRALTVSLDVRSVSSIQAMVARVLEAWGHIDILINNAGISIRKRALDFTEEEWDQTIDIMLKGVFFASRTVARHMIERGRGGKIINQASQVGLVGYFDRVPYCAAKAGVINMTRALAVEWAEHRINVNAIAPTFVNTPLVQKYLQDPVAREEALRRIPLGRIAEPEDIVGAVIYLASPASDMVTGHTLVVDGGWTAQ